MKIVTTVTSLMPIRLQSIHLKGKFSLGTTTWCESTNELTARIDFKLPKYLGGENITLIETISLKGNEHYLTNAYPLFKSMKQAYLAKHHRADIMLHHLQRVTDLMGDE